MRPKWLTAASATFEAVSFMPMSPSTRTKSAEGFSSFDLLTVRELPTTRKPRSSSARVMPNPRPLDAPVTIATCCWPAFVVEIMATPFQYLFLVYCSAEKLMHQRPNPIHFFFQREMARVEKMELRTGNISFKEFSTFHRKDSIVFAPSDQHGRLLFTEILLPIGIGIQIPFGIVEDRKLDVLVPRSVLISLVDHPIVRADLRRIADTMQIMPLGSFNRQKPVE